MVNELIKGESNVEAGLANPHCFQHTRIPQLAQDDFFIELIGSLIQEKQNNNKLITVWKRIRRKLYLQAIALNAADKIGIGRVESYHKTLQRMLELGTNRVCLF